MNTLRPKKLRTETIEPEVKKRASRKKKLSKDDPDYYSKIGQISAKKRKMTSEDFAAMAKKSHNPSSRPDGYKGGRPKKDPDTE
jgi:hypothetical protein